MSVQVLQETADSTTIEFRVEDTGIGIEEDVKKRLFRPFSQADSSTARRFGGTGLGLTISKNVCDPLIYLSGPIANRRQLVNLMHGEISLESKLDCGTIATFSIPFNRPQNAGTADAPVDFSMLPDRLQSELSLSCNSSSRGAGISMSSPQIPESSTGPSILPRQSLVRQSMSQSPSSTQLTDAQRKEFHILVVEDNAINQQIALKTIQNLKFPVNAVWNGKEALDYIWRAVEHARSPEVHDDSDKHPLPSLILMDVQMPILDGYRATHMLRHQAPYSALSIIQKIPIVAMTASAIQGDREKCERAGMDDYLAKPVKRSTLEKMLINWASGEKKVRPELHVNRPTSSMSSNEVFSVLPALGPPLLDTGAISARSDAQSSTTPIASPRPEPSSSQQYLASVQSPSHDPSVPESQQIASGGDFSNMDSEGDTGMRRALAEEKASSLRDAKLIAATTLDRDSRTHAAGASADEKHGPAVIATRESDSDYRAGPDSGIWPLTEENVGKLNADAGGRDQQTNELATPMDPDRSDAASWVSKQSPPMLQQKEDASRGLAAYATESSLGTLANPFPVLTTGHAGVSGPDRPNRSALTALMQRSSSEWSTSAATVKLSDMSSI